MLIIFIIIHYINQSAWEKSLEVEEELTLQSKAAYIEADQVLTESLSVMKVDDDQTSLEPHSEHSEDLVGTDCAPASYKAAFESKVAELSAVDVDGTGVSTALSAYFSSLSAPCPRINPAIIVRGNTVYVYGGVTELGDVEVTLDDCWSLDLNKRDVWKNVLPGSMSRLVWRGETDDVGTETTASGSESGSENDGNDDDSDSSGSDDEEQEDCAKTSISKSRAPRDRGGGVRAELDSIRAQLGEIDEMTTPHSGESQRDFYARTTVHWSAMAAKRWTEQADISGREAMSEKDLKREAFMMAAARLLLSVDFYYYCYCVMFLILNTVGTTRFFL